MKRKLSIEFIYQLFALLIVIIIVHAFYVAVIRPNAESFIKAESEHLQSDKNYVARQSVYVVVKDLEQEVCFVLFFWAVAILSYKGVTTVREQNLLYSELIPVRDGQQSTTEDISSITSIIQSLPEIQQKYLLPKSLTAGLQRFHSGGSIQDVAMAIRNICDSESERLESELFMIRYIVWAIPSIGFIGTVRGISMALGQAYKAVEGDITGVTQNLGVAFNSTLVALLISLVLMLIVHQLQSVQESYVLDTEDYCEQHLIRHLPIN